MSSSTATPTAAPISLPSIVVPESHSHRLVRAEIRDVLMSYLQRAEKGTLPLKIPQSEGRMQKHPGMHFHFNPELFFQIHGETRFNLPREEVCVQPDDCCIIPAGLPHRESVTPDHYGFRNLVGGFYSNSISLHFAFEAAPGRPDIQHILFFDAPHLVQILANCNQLTQAFHMNAPAKQYVIKGLMITLLGSLLNTVETAGEAVNRDIGKVFQVKWLVREQISNPQLNVKSIAERMQCSADYLSHLFHTETGEKLIHYIQRIRIQGAIYALETTSLYVSEIAWSSGFSDPAYFARVFKKFTGETPQSYREMLEKKRHQMDSRPKTVYHDRDEFSMGKPHVMNETLAN